MINRLADHADVMVLNGHSYRLKDGDFGCVPAATTDQS